MVKSTNHITFVVHLNVFRDEVVLEPTKEKLRSVPCLKAANDASGKEVIKGTFYVKEDTYRDALPEDFPFKDVDRVTEGGLCGAPFSKGMLVFMHTVLFQNGLL